MIPTNDVPENGAFTEFVVAESEIIYQWPELENLYFDRRHSIWTSKDLGAGMFIAHGTDYCGNISLFLCQNSVYT